MSFKMNRNRLRATEGVNVHFRDDNGLSLHCHQVTNAIDGDESEMSWDQLDAENRQG